MNKWLIAGLVVLGLASLGGGAAFAYSQAQSIPEEGAVLVTGGERPEGGLGAWPGWSGRGMRQMGRLGGIGTEAGARRDLGFYAFAQALGLPAEELQSRLVEGETLADIAEEKGMTMEQLRTAAREAIPGVLEDFVADGVMTQQQADRALEAIEQAGEGIFLRLGRNRMFGFGPQSIWGAPDGDCPCVEP
jgi:hypothetical protein